MPVLAVTVHVAPLPVTEMIDVPIRPIGVSENTEEFTPVTL